jgi:hypothetical protein
MKSESGWRVWGRMIDDCLLNPKLDQRRGMLPHDAHGSLDRDLRRPLEVLRFEMISARDATSTTRHDDYCGMGPKVVIGEPGDLLRGRILGRFFAAVGATDELLEAPEITAAHVVAARPKLRCALGRSLMKPGLRLEKKVLAITMAMNNPSKSNQEIADTVGVHVNNLTDMKRWGRNIKDARAQGRRDAAPAAAEKLFSDRGRRVGRRPPDLLSEAD